MMLHTTVILVGVSLFLAACGDDTEGAGGSGAGGATSATSSTTSSSTASSTSTGGDEGGGGSTSTGAGGDGGGGAPACSGDAQAFEAIQTTGVACEVHADCCVVVNGCLAEAIVVGAADFEQAQATWPTCDDACVDCVVPYVEIACEDGVCVGYADEVDLAPDAVSHCGVEEPSLGNNGPGERFDCSGAPL